MSDILKNTILHELPVPALVVSTTGQIHELNSQAKSLFKPISMHPELINNVFDIVESKEKKRFAKFFRAIKADSGNYLEIQLKSQKKLIWIELSATRIKLGKKNDAFLLILRDITQDIESQRRLRLHYEISKAIATGNKIEDTFYKIIKAIVDSSSWYCGVAWLTDFKGELEFLCCAFPRSTSISQFAKQTEKGKIDEKSLPYRVL